MLTLDYTIHVDSNTRTVPWGCRMRLHRSLPVSRSARMMASLQVSPTATLG